MNKNKYEYSKGNTCPDCGNIIENRSKHCTSCRQRGERNYQWKGGKNQLTEKARREEMCQFRSNGLSYAAIGEFYGVSKQRVYQVLGSDGKYNSKIQINREWLRVQLEVKGRRVTDIANELGVSDTTVHNRINCHGFKRRTIWGPGEWPIKPASRGAGGYLFVYSPFHPHTNHGNRVFQHRLVAEKYLGRYLRPGPSGEASHHIDGNRTNNEPKNLCIFENVGYHTAFHRWLRGECRPIDESRITWVVPESREQMIKFCEWPEPFPKGVHQ